MGPIVEEHGDAAPYVSFSGTPQYPRAAEQLQALLTSFNDDSPAARMELAASNLQLPDMTPISSWVSHTGLPPSAIQVDQHTWVAEVTADSAQLLTLATRSSLPADLHLAIHTALRADSAGAPETIYEAHARGHPWPEATDKEMRNHSANGSWREIRRDEVPAGRRLHKLVWVFKQKRDGTAKARLCVQGCTLQSGIDYDQTFSQTLRYASARSLFALAARLGCSVRSVDLVAAYLQGEFIEGESVYCYMPPGYVKKDENGNPFVVEVVKPIYGIPQAGRRLQRKLSPWMTDVAGLQRLDDSDGCVFVYRDPSGKEVFAIGIYVDNLQIVHSAALDNDGNAIDQSSFYANFMKLLRRDWEIVDEGPLEDLLAIQMRTNNDGSITLHQFDYIQKLLLRFLPNGPLPYVTRKSAPCSKTFERDVALALDGGPASNPDYPELVRDFQCRLGSLLYLTTSTRPDLGFAVPYLCRAMSRPTPELVEATDRIFSYLYHHSAVGLTYEPRATLLSGQSDASWETRYSTSGWVVYWQGAAISWGSRKQDSIALSSCEAEIVALSEASKEMVFFRKLVSGLDPSSISGPSELATDNTGARDLSYNPEHHNRVKHVERRHFFVRDMVEKFELVVPFVRTLENTADFFTKALDGTKFFNFRRLIMNEPRGKTSSALA